MDSRRHPDGVRAEGLQDGYGDQLSPGHDHAEEAEQCLSRQLRDHSFIQEKAYGEKSGKALGTADAPPVGTGPYVVDTFGADKIDLVRNDAYADEAPAPDQITFTTISTDNAAQLAMRSSELDAFALLDVKSAGTWKSVPGVSIYSTPTLYLDYVTLNTAVAPFDDVHVRRALAYATDVAGLL